MMNSIDNLAKGAIY